MRRHSACVAHAPAPGRSIWSGAEAMPMSFDVADERSEGGTRRIDILDHDLMIERRIAGVKMRLSIPFTLYEGVALDIRAHPAGFGAIFSLRLVHEDSALDVPLYEAEHDRDI